MLSRLRGNSASLWVLGRGPKLQLDQGGGHPDKHGGLGFRVKPYINPKRFLKDDVAALRRGQKVEADSLQIRGV